MTNMFESRFKEKLNTVADMWFANLLWLAFCLPIITIPPSTFALYHVSQTWVKDSSDGLLREFWRGFRLYFWRSYLYTLGLLLIALDIYFYYGALQSDSGTALVIGLGLTLFLTLAAVLTSLYFFSLNMMVELRFDKLLIFSVMFAIRHPWVTILFFLGFLLVLLGTYLFPYLLFIGVIPALTYLQNKLIYRQLQETCTPD